MTKQKEPIAILSFGIGAGILIYDIDDEAVIFTWEIDGKTKPQRRSQIRFSTSGEAYFITNKRRYYLKDFLKTNIGG